MDLAQYSTEDLLDMLLVQKADPVVEEEKSLLDLPFTKSILEIKKAFPDATLEEIDDFFKRRGE